MRFSIMVVYHNRGNELPRPNECVSIWITDPGQLRPEEEIFQETTNQDGKVTLDYGTDNKQLYIKVYVGSRGPIEFMVNEDKNAFTVSYQYDREEHEWSGATNCEL